MDTKMRILIACEFSGIVRDAFRSKGHDAWSCDFLSSEAEYQGYHLEGNCLDWVYNGSWDMMIAHPPCTYFCNSGVRWLKTGDYEKTIPRWNELYKAAGFFKLLLDAPIPKIAVENPIPHRYAVELIGRKYDLGNSGMAKPKQLVYGSKDYQNLLHQILWKAEKRGFTKCLLQKIALSSDQ